VTQGAILKSQMVAEWQLIDIDREDFSLQKQLLFSIKQKGWEPQGLRLI
jgi:hypothetical protein